jgi:hypothetical protein
MLVEGVRYQADVELQGVFVPHLVSLPKGYASVRKELDRLERLEWYEYYAALPFRPVYSNAQGATPRNSSSAGAGLRRVEARGMKHSIRTGSALGRSTMLLAGHFLADGRPEMMEYLRIRSLPPSADTIAALAHTRDIKWPLQRMPTISHVMTDLTILRRAAHLLGEPVYIFEDNIKDYFNHLENAPKNFGSVSSHS